jgi:hypothetical protein
MKTSLPSSDDVKKCLASSIVAISLAGSLMSPVHAHPLLTAAALTNSPVRYPPGRPSWSSPVQPPVIKTAIDSGLDEFVSLVVNGDSNTIVGVYVPGVLALSVGQQPRGNAGFVTREAEKATQFDLAGQYGTVGILAHNDLAGEKFSGISLSQYAIIVYGDGRLAYYQIDEIQRYQALSPTSTFSEFVNQDGSYEQISASKLFSRVYGPGDRLVFQTCIAANGDPSWGRIFIIGRPVTGQVLQLFEQTSFVMDFASFGLVSQ